MDKSISRQYFNDRAETWDETIKNNDSSKLQVLIDRMQIEPSMTILDVGSGTGVFLPYLIKKLDGKGKIISLDYALNMLKKAKQKKFNHMVHFLCAEIENIHLASASFDVILCYSTFPHLHNKHKALSNMNYLLKSGGRVYICHTANRSVINAIHFDIPDLQDHLLPTSSHLHKMLKNAGFKMISVKDEPGSYWATAMK